MQLLMLLSLSALILPSVIVDIPKIYGQECVSVIAENSADDSRFVKLHLSAQEGCADIYGLYVQIERNGSIKAITSSPLGWSYGETEKAAFWTTDTEPVGLDSKIFGMQLQTQKPHALRWIALDQAWSPVAEGILVG